MGFAPQDQIQKPDNKTIRQQDDDGGETRPMPNMAHLERDQRSGRKDHEQFRPALLQINANAFSEENGGIKKREKSWRAELPIFEHILQFIQQKMNSFAVSEENFLVCPIRNRVQPARATVQEEERKAEDEQEQPL